MSLMSRKRGSTFVATVMFPSWPLKTSAASLGARPVQLLQAARHLEIGDAITHTWAMMRGLVVAGAVRRADD
jgi:hypothetical protein